VRAAESEEAGSEAVSDVVGVTNSLLFRAPQSEDAVSESRDLRQLDETHCYIRGLKLLVYEPLSYLLLEYEALSYPMLVVGVTLVKGLISYLSCAYPVAP
jgi:hypothetical protein